MKLAYWPGCVSRGFTPELHGSMALTAEALGIELVTLDRANCCGAGVIAEHNQELADTLNARTFALAQETGLAMMNICSTCQGAQSECQERLDADSAYRAHINDTLSGEGLSYTKDKDGFTNKNFLWLLVEDYGLDKLAAKVKRPLEGLRVGPFYGCYVLRPKTRLGYDEFPDRDLYLEQVIEVLGGQVVDYDGARRCCGFPVITMNRETSLRQAGTHVGDAIDAGRRLPRHAVPALPPQPRHAAAGGREGRRPRPRPRRPAPPAAGRAGARLRPEAARHAEAHRLDDRGRGPGLSARLAAVPGILLLRRTRRRSRRSSSVRVTSTVDLVAVGSGQLALELGALLGLLVVGTGDADVGGIDAGLRRELIGELLSRGRRSRSSCRRSRCCSRAPRRPDGDATARILAVHGSPLVRSDARTRAGDGSASGGP